MKSNSKILPWIRNDYPWIDSHQEKKGKMPMMLDFLPTVNAVLNSTSAVLLITAHRYIKRGNKRAHRNLMIATFVVSSIFLVSYLTYHSYHGTTRFLGE